MSDKPKKRMGYKESVQWLYNNDDNDWIWLKDPDDNFPSVAASLVADIFQDGDTEKIKKDLLKLYDKEK